MQSLHALCLWRWQRYKRCTNISKNTSNIINVVTTQHCRCRANILMNTSIVANVTTMQRCKCRANILMNTSIIANVTTMQRCKCRANILMNTSSIANVTTMQRCKRYVGISMNVFYNINALISQLGTSCVFDSPGLARNEPTPGKRSQGDSTL